MEGNSECKHQQQGTMDIMHRHLHFGLDVGSGTAKAVAVDDQGAVLFSTYRPTQGRPLSMARQIMDDFQNRFSPRDMASMVCTGTGGKRIASILGVHFVNEIICHTKGVEWFHPQARTIIDIGGEDAKLILVRPSADGGLSIKDFALNTVCAAGTGAFLEQQAARLGYDIQTFSSLAENAASVPTIAGRCTVFAKSDMIHLQQSGVQDDEIIAGLCFAIVRNLKTNIAKGKKLTPPLVFQGGVAANMGVRRAIRELLVSSPEQLIIPEHFKVMGAVGAALEGRQQTQASPYPGPEALDRALQKDAAVTDRLPPLHVPAAPARESRAEGALADCTDSREPVPVVLGIDVGSVSTKMVLLDRQACLEGRQQVVAKTYLATSGRPLQAVASGLQALSAQTEFPIQVTAVGSTGSGRALCAAYVGGDVIRNEISAQAAAATWLDPEVDTIFEIGGQDSKYIRLENEVIVDFAMNKVCAAGTGSFLEEQSVRLGIHVQDFGELALSAQAPVKMGERCTVFMQSDLVHFQQQGVTKADLAAGLCHSIVANYLNKVVEQRPVGKRVFFQGGTAFNQGITAAFGQALGQEVTVPAHNEVTGAIGVALLALRQHRGQSRFLGFDLSRRTARTKYFECPGCANACEVQQVRFEGESRPLHFGHRCERYDDPQQSRGLTRGRDLVQERQDLMSEYAAMHSPLPSEGPHIGLPRCLFFQEWLPFFSTLFSELGYTVVGSDPTTRKQVSVGAERMVTEACLPMKAAHGHLQDLVDKGVSTIFLPQISTVPAWDQAENSGSICPYVQSVPWIIHSAFDLQAQGITLVSPVLRLGREAGGNVAQWKELAHSLGVSWKAMRRALDRAWAVQHRFARTLREQGRELLQRVQAGERAVLLIGRPYNALDPGMSMNVARKVSKLGVHVMSIDHLPQPEQDPDQQQMYWAYGKRILAAGRMLQAYPNLVPVFVTNFSCGPDAFILHFFERQLGKRPYLELEIDEHTADAGVLTRLEAFLDSTSAPDDEAASQAPPFVRSNTGFRSGCILYIPFMTDHLQAFSAAFAANGVQARILPVSDQESLGLGRKFTKGKECLPAVLTTGDILKAVQAPDFDPHRAAFFMPASGGPCRFGLYHQLHRIMLEEVGMGHVPVFSPNQGTRLYQELGVVSKDFTKLAWKGVVAVDLLVKFLLETRPYVRNVQECNDLYTHWLQRISQAVAREKDVRPLVRQAADDFADLPRQQTSPKPVVGIVGEIYVRSNPFANEYLVQRLEALGLEAWLPTIGEWIHYINHTGKVHARRRREFKSWFKLEMESLVQDRLERRILQAGNGWLRSLPEPETRHLLHDASPYLSPAFEGEAVLSIGKSVDYMRKKVQGLINVMPFTCMPGGVVDAIMPRLRQESSIPMLSLAYDGQTETNIQNRLEAFAYQVKQQGGAS